MLKNGIYNFILILLIILEGLFAFVFHQEYQVTQEVTSTGFFTVTFLFGFVLLFKFYNVPELTLQEKMSNGWKYFLYLLFAASFFLLNGITIHIIKTIDYSKISDIILMIQILAKRFISGQYPYNGDAFLHYGKSVAPGYLTMHWLPYTIPAYFHFDDRTMTFVIWCLGAYTVLFRSLRNRKPWVSIILVLLTTAAYWIIAVESPNTLGVTVETMVAGYYMLMIAGLNQKNAILTGIIFSVCLLSRYYIAVWLPLWVFVMYLSGYKKELFKTILVVICMVMVLFIIPFLFRDWHAIANAFNNYQNLPINEWHNIGPGDVPYHLYSGTGFAYIFYQKYVHADLVKGFNLLKHVLFLSTFSIIILLGILYWFIRKKINYRIFLLASFKIYLSVFLAFIMVPYTYLTVSGIFISIAIFAEQSRYNIQKKQ